MDDYEVDLIDYLRVMWRGKWIIIGCFIVAVAVSTAIMWTRPNEYAVTVSYQYHDQLSQLVSLRQSDPNNQVPIVAAGQDNALSTTVDNTPLPSAGEKLSKKIAIQSGAGSVTLSGPVPASKLKQFANSFSALVKKNLAQQMKDSILLAVNSANLRVAQFSKERDMLKERMAAAMATNDPLTSYLAEKVADLEGMIVQNQALAETLQASAPTALFQLISSQRGPSLVGPKRKMSVAVAGVLGLFIGVLLAFFVHYLIGARDKEATRKRA